MESTYVCTSCKKEINMNNKILHDSTCFMNYPSFDKKLDVEKKDIKEKKEVKKRCPYCNFDFVDEGDFFVNHILMHENEIKLICENNKKRN